MKQLALAIILVLTLGLALLPGVAWAGHVFAKGSDVKVRSGDTGSGHGPHFIGHERNARPIPGHGPHFIGHEFIRHPRTIHRHDFVHHEVHVHHHFVHHGFFHPQFHRLIHPHFGPAVIIVDPTPRPIWIPGFWHWDGFRWVWVPGHWVFPGHRLVPRNPCD